MSYFAICSEVLPFAVKSWPLPCGIKHRVSFLLFAHLLPEGLGKGGDAVGKVLHLLDGAWPVSRVMCVARLGLAGADGVQGDAWFTLGVAPRGPCVFVCAAVQHSRWIAQEHLQTEEDGGLCEIHELSMNYVFVQCRGTLGHERVESWTAREGLSTLTQPRSSLRTACVASCVGARSMHDVYAYSHIMEYVDVQHSILSTAAGCCCSCCRGRCFLAAKRSHQLRAAS